MKVKLTKYLSNIYDIKKSKNIHVHCNLQNLYYLIILCFLYNLTNEQNSISISKIILTIKGSGYQNVLSTYSGCKDLCPNPDEIFVNNVYQERNNENMY